MWLFKKSFILFFFTLSFGFNQRVLANSNYFEFNQTKDQQIRLPHQYELNKQRYSERGQIIPAYANQSTSPGAFAGSVLRYHFSSVLEKQGFLSTGKLKKLQNSLSQSTQMSTSFVKITPKLQINRLSATLDIESILDSKIWTEDSFQTIRSQVQIFRAENRLVSLEYLSNRQDSRTYLNWQKTW